MTGHCLPLQRISLWVTIRAYPLPRRPVTHAALRLRLQERQRDEAKRLLIAGINPSTKRKEEKILAITEARSTFGLIAEEYIARMEERKAAATLIKTKWLLEGLASPLAKRPIKEITAAEILQLLQKIEKSGRRETARRFARRDRECFSAGDCHPPCRD